MRKSQNELLTLLKVLYHWDQKALKIYVTSDSRRCSKTNISILFMLFVIITSITLLHHLIYIHNFGPFHRLVNIITSVVVQHISPFA